MTLEAMAAPTWMRGPSGPTASPEAQLRAVPMTLTRRVIGWRRSGTWFPLR